MALIHSKQVVCEVFLDGVKIKCGNCSILFYVCSSCWRNQKYCGQVCAKEARLRYQRISQKTYRESKKGKLKQSQYQAIYRKTILIPKLKKIVSEHTSKVQKKYVISSSDKLECEFCMVQIKHVSNVFEFGGP
jgi:hypothetical protein